MKRLRRIAAAIALATAATTGALLTNTLTASPAADTAWGAPSTTDTGATETTEPATDGTAVTPLDTAWG